MGDSDADDNLYSEGPELQEIEELPPAEIIKSPLYSDFI
jgi:hypothetical protein